jgi:hypothetical protein
MHLRVRTTLIFALTGLLLGLQPLAAIAAPLNDELDHATPVTQVPFADIVDVSDATVAIGEPQPWCAPVTNTVWYRIELPKRTDVVVDTAGSSFDTVLAVYDAELGLITCNDDVNGDSYSLQARLGFSAARRTTYYVQAGSYPSDVWEDEEALWDVVPADLELVLSIEEGRLPRVSPRPERYTFAGRYAEAMDGYYDEGIWREAGVFVLDGRANRETIQEVNLYSFEETYDPEKETYLVTEWWGSTPITNAGISRRLDEAYVDQSIEVSGYRCGYPAYDDGNGDNGWDEENGYEGLDLENGDENNCWPLGPEIVDLDVTWTGVGSVSRVQDHYSEVGPWGTYRSHYRAQSREAMVTGGAFGEEVMISFDDAYGRIANVRSSDMFQPARR